MSDPVSNAEIEDVLSSIRRLVSQRKATAPEVVPKPSPEASTAGVADAAPAPSVDTPPALSTVEARETDTAEEQPLSSSPEGPTDAQAEPAEIPAADIGPESSATQPSVDEPSDVVDQTKDAEVSPDQSATEPETTPETVDAPNAALVLTPAQRVEDAEPPAFSAAEETLPPDDGSLQTRIEELEAALDQSGGEWEPDGSEEQHLPTEMPPKVEDAVEAEDPAPLVFRHSSETDAAEESDSVDVEPPLVFNSDRTTIDEEAQDADWTSVQSEPEDVSSPDAAETSAVASSEGAELASAGAETASSSQRLQLVPEDADPEPEPQPAVSYEVVGDSPDVTGADPWDETTTDADIVNAEVEDEWDDADDPIDLLADDPGVILDEETLREMVSEMIRAEMQGALGEKITRNVRKLVRREVQNALAARDLD